MHCKVKIGVPIPLWLLIAGVLLSSGCGQGDGETTSQSAGEPSDAAAGTPPAESGGARDLRVVVVQPGLDSRSLLTTFLEPMVDAQVMSRFDGVVQSVDVMEGQWVEEGAVLGRLEDDEQRLEWERADAVADQAEAEFERAQKLSERDVISVHDLEVAAAGARIKRAEARAARLEYDRCTLRAPINGVVRLVRARPFAVVEEFEVLFWVANSSILRASLYLPATMRGKIKQGNKVRISPVIDTGSRSVSGRVRMVNPVADPVTGLFRVEIEVASGGGLEAGSDVRVSFAEKGGEEEVAAAGLSGAVLPSNTYLEREGPEIYAYVVEEGIAQRIAIELGEIGPHGFRVLSGVSPGDLVVAAGQIPPSHGDPVNAHLSPVPEP